MGARAVQATVGIVAAGSLVCGCPDVASDMDICLIHLDPYRRRLHRRFRWRTCGYFVNPPHVIRGDFASKPESARPVMAHMLASGAVVLNRIPVVVKLIAEARELRAAPLPL